MHRLVAWVQASRVALGGPGLFLIAFLDSSFLSFPEVVDLLIIWLVTRTRSGCSTTRCCRRSGRSPAASRSTWSGARAAKRFCAGASASSHVDRALRCVPEVRPAGRRRAVAPAAAGAVQAVRARGRGCRRAPVRLSRRGRHRPRHPLFRRRRCWRSGTASGLLQFLRDNAAPGVARLRVAACSSAACVWIWYKPAAGDTPVPIDGLPRKR